jgi:hypothetical protein
MSRGTSVGVRQLLNETPKLAGAVAAGVIVVAVAVAWALWRSDRADQATVGRPGQAYFSNDDGKTWFPADASSLPPFEKDGKQALRAYVFKGADGKPFVSCLARYAPQTRKELQANYAREPERRNPMVIAQLELDGLEVKPPGQDLWLRRPDPRAADLLTPRLPDGTYAEPVLP